MAKNENPGMPEINRKLSKSKKHPVKIKRNQLNNFFSKAKCIMKLASGEKIQDLKR